MYIPRLTSCAEILIQQGVPLAGGVHSDDMLSGFSSLVVLERVDQVETVKSNGKLAENIPLG